MLHSSCAVAAHLSSGEASEASAIIPEVERMLAAALPGRRGVHRGSAVVAAAAAEVTVALGTEMLSGSRGLGRLSGRPDGCAGRVCQVRGRAVPSGARRGPGWPCVESAADAPFACPRLFIFLFLSVSFLLSPFKRLKRFLALQKP